MIREEMMSRMSATEFLHWQLLERIEPFGEKADYLRAGIIASTIANVNRSKETKAFKPEDFMPVIKEPEKPQTPEQIAAGLWLVKAAQDAREARLNNG